MGASLSVAHGHDDCTVRRWRIDRRCCPRRRRAHVAHARTAVHRRQRSWGRWHYRLNTGDARQTRRPHHPDGQFRNPCLLCFALPNLAYKPDVDFEPIGMVVEQPVLIAARKDFPPKDLNEFATYVKANVEKLNMAHAGAGSVTFTLGLLLNSILGVKLTLVAF